MVDRKPNLAAYARVSYFRELHGDLDGALAAMRAARRRRRRRRPRTTPTCSALLGGLELQTRPHRPPPGAPYRGRSPAVPGYPAAEAGLAQADVARGRLPPAIARLAARSSSGCRCPST